MRADRHDFNLWVRAHHPDVGGDPERFAAGLERWRAGAATGVGAKTWGTGNVTVFRSRGGLWPLARWARRRCGAKRHLA
ncbi:hypothetical protein [Actinoallomurus soli]|uniref:hypothetical protein n=1 Tax=Actinoallomurus soli TaxID=2952535 RepID=UPI0020934C08|nr:hypothetical protein [Actinoallomurus soli]MCO5974011.1 hypothetical protein [Actinoallomurus soli]